MKGRRRGTKCRGKNKAVQMRRLIDE